VYFNTKTKNWLKKHGTGTYFISVNIILLVHITSVCGDGETVYKISEFYFLLRELITQQYFIAFSCHKNSATVFIVREREMLYKLRFWIMKDTIMIVVGYRKSLFTPR
jgi:hypothetical protein